MNSLVQDLRFAARALARNPAFAAVAVLTLALGIGANAAIFGAVNGLLFRPLPVREPDRLVALFSLHGSGREPSGFSYPTYLDLRDKGTAFAGMIGQYGTPLSLSTGDRAEMAWGELVTSNYFSVLGVQPAVGRLFGPADDHGPGSMPYAVLSHAYWQSRFAADPRVVGQSIRLNGHPFTVVGVAPSGFTDTRLFAFLPDAWVPLPMHAQIIPGSERWLPTNRGVGVLIVMARLASGVSLEQAQAATSGLLRQLAAEHPPGEMDAALLVMPGRPPFAHPGFVPRSALAFGASLSLGGVGLVLLVACANVASLLLARATARRREVGIRLALGASRGRLVRLLLTESLLLSVGGGALGLLLAAWGASFESALLPPSPFRLGFDAGIDFRVVAFTAALAILATVLAGLTPALQSARTDVLPALKDDAGGARAGRLSVRSILVVAQLAVSLLLIVGGGLFLKGLREGRRMDLGFRTEGALMFSVNPGIQGHDEAHGQELYLRLVERVRGLSSVSSVALAYPLPLDFTTSGADVVSEGREAPPEEQKISGLFSIVDEGYYETLGTPIVRGRGFTEQDREGARRVAVVNETMARRYWPGADAIGHRLRFGDAGPSLDVVGVARDGTYGFIGEDPRPYFFLPLAQNYSSPITMVVRSAADPKVLAGMLEREVSALDPDLPAFGMMTLEAFRRRSLSALEGGAIYSVSFGLLALGLAAVGLYGVVSYAVGQRTREIGVRVALGAGRGDVLRMVLGGAFRLGLVGVALGLGLALGAAPLLSSVLPGVSGRDPLVFGVAPALLLAVVLLASLGPARRAARVEPRVALRSE